MSAEHTEPRDKVDPSAPVFFLSYAHAPMRPGGQPTDQNRLFAEFFEELSADVAQLVSLPPGSEPGYMGYMDRSIGTGKHWTPALLRAIGTCQVFVALLSAGYFASTWCSQEWYAFSQRSVTGPPDSQNIAPVVWAPIYEKNIPLTVKKVQRFRPVNLIDPNIATHYEREGIYGLHKMSKDFYSLLIWKLAQEIADMYYHHHAIPKILNESELRDPFKENGLGQS
jgi:hypothetical protein